MTPGRPPGRKTPAGTSQNTNQSGVVGSPVSDSSTPAQESGDDNALEDEGRQGQKPKVLWLAAREILFEGYLLFSDS